MPYGIKVENKSADTAEIQIYGPITDEKWFDEEVTPVEFKREMDKLKDVSKINMYVNSPGGGVFAGHTIYNIIKRHPANVEAHIDGIAASIASVVVMAADSIHIPKNALMMIHNPHAMTMGEAEDMRKTADILDRVKETIVATYATRAKTGEDEIRQMMDAETWMTGEEAYAYGFADVLEEDVKIAACIRGNTAIFNGQKFSLDAFSAFPRQYYERGSEPVKNRTAADPSPDPEPAPAAAPDYSEYETAICEAGFALCI